MKGLKIVGTNTLLQMAKQLFDRGEITQEQFKKMDERNAQLNATKREDIIIKEE